VTPIFIRHFTAPLLTQHKAEITLENSCKTALISAAGKQGFLAGIRFRDTVIAVIANTSSNTVGSMTASTEKGKAIIKIIGYIGSEKTNAETLSALVDDFLAKGIKSAIVRISSGGGSVFQASDMVAELERFESVNMEVGALAASAATRFCARFHTTARPNSQLMIHRPMGRAEGNEKEIEQGLKQIKDATSDYRKAYATKMGKTEAEIETMWADGDKWMTAKEAKALKLIDGITGEPETIDAATAEMLVACGAPKAAATPPKADTIPPQNQPKNKMDRDQLIASLGMDADSTDAQINARIAANKSAAEASKAAEKKELETRAERAETDVTAAITDKKLLATQKDAWVKMYMAEPVATKSQLDAMVSIPKLSKEIEGKGGAKDLEASRKEWTLETYMEQDPQALEALEKENPERFEQLNAAYFAKP
jgi:ATP-dependent Clp protease protease subunit